MLSSKQRKRGLVHKPERTGSQPGFTYRPVPEKRDILEDIRDKTGISVSAIMDAAFDALLRDDTDPIVQLYRLRKGVANG